MIKRRSSSESNKKRSDKRTDPSSSTKGKSTLSSWHKFKMSLSMRKKEKPRKVEESEVSNSVDLTNLEGPPALKKQTVDDAGFESTPTVESKDSLKKEKESSSGRRHNESNAGKKAAAPPAPVQDATPKVDSSAKKARGIRRKFSASKPASKKAAVRVQVENKPAVETCFVQDKLDHKALEAKMKKKHRRDLCLSIGIAYCSAVIMVGLAVSGLVGTYFYYHTHFELQRHKLIALYAAKNSKWEIHNCGKLNATMDMYRKRGRMYEHSKCELRRNQSTLDAAPWSGWTTCAITKDNMARKFRWKVLQPNTAYNLRAPGRNRLVESMSCELSASPTTSSLRFTTSTSPPSSTTNTNSKAKPTPESSSSN